MEMVTTIGAGWMNLAALVLGLTAWALPVVSMLCAAVRPARAAAGRVLPFTGASFAACAAALYFSIRYNAHLARIGDTSAFLDTAEAFSFVAGVLLVVTAGLNILALCAASLCARKRAAGCPPEQRI